MRSVQKFALMMCVIIVLATFGALALARAEGCTACENGVMQRVEVSDPYGYKNTLVYCSITKVNNDIKQTWYVDELWECSNPNCSVAYTDTVLKSKITCKHK